MSQRTPTSFRLPPETVAQLGELARHFADDRGAKVTRTAMLRELIARTHRAFVTTTRSDAPAK
jgi:predicted DNA-binding protein